MSVHFARRGFGILAITLAMMTVFAAISTGGRVHAQEAGPLEEGRTIVFEECSIVSGVVQPSDALFTNVFWRFGPDVNLGVISSDASGTPFVIGEVPAGEELILGIDVSETPYRYMTGSR